MSSQVLRGGYAVHVQGTYAYVADGPGGVLVFDVSNPLVTPPLSGHIALDGNQYATTIVPSQDTLFVVGVDPRSYLSSNIYTLAPSSPGTPGSPAIVARFGNDSNAYIWQDAALQGNFLYVATAKRGRALALRLFAWERFQGRQSQRSAGGGSANLHRRGANLHRGQPDANMQWAAAAPVRE